MLIEDYCSYEVAKLLIEWGFPFMCNVGSLWVDKQGKTKLHNSFAPITWVNEDDADTPCVTQALAMKWLREQQGIIITIDYDEDDDKRYGFTTYCKNERDVGVGTYPTYEQAVEAALKYCLTTIQIYERDKNSKTT